MDIHEEIDGLNIDRFGAFHVSRGLGYHHWLLIRPTNEGDVRELDTWTAREGDPYGPDGHPTEVWNRMSARLPIMDNAHGPDVADVLHEEADRLEEIAGCYRGFEWTGMAKMGQWSGLESVRQGLRIALQRNVRFECTREEFLDWWVYGFSLAETYEQFGVGEHLEYEVARVTKNAVNDGIFLFGGEQGYEVIRDAIIEFVPDAPDEWEND